MQIQYHAFCPCSLESRSYVLFSRRVHCWLLYLSLYFKVKKHNELKVMSKISSFIYTMKFNSLSYKVLYSSRSSTHPNGSCVFNDCRLRCYHLSFINPIFIVGAFCILIRIGLLNLPSQRDITHDSPLKSSLMKNATSMSLNHAKSIRIKACGQLIALRLFE